MPRMLHRAGVHGSRSVFLAIPVYGDISPECAYTLFHVERALKDAGIDSELAIYAGDCHVDDARNRLVRDFLESDCDDLVFIDSDIRFEAESLVKLLNYDADVVGGAYPLKQKEEAYPVRFIPGEIWSNDQGLIEVLSLPTGFLRIKRCVLEHLALHSVKFNPKSDSRSQLPVIFERGVIDNCRFGGDVNFCRKCRDFDIKIYLDPSVWFEHDNYSGRISSFLKKENGQVLPQLDDIHNGDTTVFYELFREWDNPWAASPEMLAALSYLAKGNILETGSGLSTLVMAKTTEGQVYSLEHNHEWADKLEAIALELGIDNINVIRSPLVDGWYTNVPNIDFDVVINDGPPRSLGDRSKLFDKVKINGAMVIMDDMEDNNQELIANQYALSSGKTINIVGQTRPFAVIK